MVGFNANYDNSLSIVADKYDSDCETVSESTALNENVEYNPDSCGWLVGYQFVG